MERETEGGWSEWQREIVREAEAWSEWQRRMGGVT